MYGDDTMALEDVWMITCWSEEMLEKKGITIDCSSPDGNAFGLLALAEDIGRQMGWDDRQMVKCLTEMKSGDYEHLVLTFEKCFSFYVTLKFDVHPSSKNFYRG